MTNYIKQLDSEFQNFRDEANRLIEKFDVDAYVQHGVVRWKNNDRVPPQDVLDLWQHVGHEFDMRKSQVLRESEQQQFLEEYRKRMENYEPSEEELGEMRAAFGPGETVVNVITGKEIKL